MNTPDWYADGDTRTRNEPRWEDPPEHPTRYHTILQPLRQHPHRWARIADNLTHKEATNKVRYLRQTRGPLRDDAPNWQIRHARTSDHTNPTYSWAVWARYTPPGDTEQ